MIRKLSKLALLFAVLGFANCTTRDDDKALNEPASADIPDTPGNAEGIPTGPMAEQADILPAEVDPEPDLPAPELKKELKKADKKVVKKIKKKKAESEQEDNATRP